jgi:hypothetical protein
MRLPSSIVSFVYSLPFLLVLSTVFVVAPGLENGATSGKYFWFYLSMAITTVTQSGIVLTSSGRKFPGMGIADGLVLLYGFVALFTSCVLHHSEAVTKHILLALVIVLYFCFKLLFHRNRQSHYWVVLFFLTTGLIESLFQEKSVMLCFSKIIMISSVSHYDNLPESS